MAREVPAEQQDSLVAIIDEQGMSAAILYLKGHFPEATLDELADMVFQFRSAAFQRGLERLLGRMEKTDGSR